MRLDGCRRGDDLGLGQRTTVDNVEERVEEEREPKAAGVDDACFLEHGQQVGRVLDRGVRGLGGALQEGVERGVVPAGRLGSFCGLAHDGEDGALHRAHHCLIGSVGSLAQRRRDLGSADGFERCERVGHAAQDLRQDHAGVAPRAHERAVRHRLAHVVHPRGVADLGAHRLERQRHVGPGVAVGHRIDVEQVELVLVAPERVAVAHHDLGERGAVERSERGHRGAIVVSDPFPSGLAWVRRGLPLLP